MDKTTPVERDIESGEQLINALEQEGVEVSASFWIYNDESANWQFFHFNYFLNIGEPNLARRLYILRLLD